MTQTIDPLVDIVFKAIFGSPKHPNIPIHFLNTILNLQGDRRIAHIEIRNPFNITESMQAKETILDIHIWDHKERPFQIDLQLHAHKAINHRALYYWACHYTNQIKSGEDYPKLRPVISVWIMGYDLMYMPPVVDGFPKPTPAIISPYGHYKRPDLVHIPFTLHSPKANCYLSDHLAIHVIQLSNLAPNAIINNDKARWLHFLRNGKHLDLHHPPEWMNTPEMQEVTQIMKTFTERDKNLYDYLRRLDYIRNQRTIAAEHREAVSDLEETKSQLHDTKSQLHDTKTKLQEAETSEAKTQAENEQLKAQLKALGVQPVTDTHL